MPRRLVLNAGSTLPSPLLTPPVPVLYTGLPRPASSYSSFQLPPAYTAAFLSPATSAVSAFSRPTRSLSFSPSRPFLSSLSPALDFFFPPQHLSSYYSFSYRASVLLSKAKYRQLANRYEFSSQFIRFKRAIRKNIFLFTQIHARAIFFLQEPFEIKILIFDRKRNIIKEYFIEKIVCFIMSPPRERERPRYILRLVSCL